MRRTVALFAVTALVLTGCFTSRDTAERSSVNQGLQSASPRARDGAATRLPQEELRREAHRASGQRGIIRPEPRESLAPPGSPEEIAEAYNDLPPAVREGYERREPVREMAVVDSSTMGLTCSGYLHDPLAPPEPARLTVPAGYAFSADLVCRQFTGDPATYTMEVIFVWPAGIWARKPLYFMEPPSEFVGSGVRIWAAGMVAHLPGHYTVYFLINETAVARLELEVQERPVR